jgi:hypothetical protein
MSFGEASIATMALNDFAVLAILARACMQAGRRDMHVCRHAGRQSRQAIQVGMQSR